MESKLDRKTIIKALSLLDDALRREEVIGEICIFGGAAMILAFDATFATRDVDAIFVPKTQFLLEEIFQDFSSES